MESVPDFLVDQLYLISVAVFAAASFGIIRRSRRGQPRSGGRVGLAGLRTAAIASVVSVAVLALVVVSLGWLLRAMCWENCASPTPSTVDQSGRIWDNIIGILWLISIPGVTFLAVLDLFAIRPPDTRDQTRDARSYAVLGTLFSLFLISVSLLVPVVIDGARSAAAERDAREAGDQLAREIEARSTGLSIDVAVVDPGLGTATQNGHQVDRLALDIRLRSATEIELRESEDGFGLNLLLLDPAYAPGADYSPPMYLEWTNLPTHIPAGFDATYRLDVPVAGTFPANGLQPDPVTTGLWGIQLTLFDRDPGPARMTTNGPSELRYEVEASFTVPDAR